MNRLFHTFLPILLAAILGGIASQAAAAGFNDKVLNRPYADMRRWHLGFSVGVHTQDFLFTHNGYVTDNGEEWYMEQPGFSPGFCVNGLIDYRLGTYFNLRFTPGMYFGNRDVTFREYNTGAQLRQNVKSAYVVMPLDLKFSGMRLRNSRPYLTAGVMPALNVTAKKGDYLRVKPMELFLTAGFGCDFYLHYFKFIPEVKFCFGLTDALVHDRPDLEDEPDKLKITRSLGKALSRMVVFTFYFE